MGHIVQRMSATYGRAETAQAPHPSLEPLRLVNRSAAMVMHAFVASMRRLPVAGSQGMASCGCHGGHWRASARYGGRARVPLTHFTFCKAPAECCAIKICTLCHREPPALRRKIACVRFALQPSSLDLSSRALFAYTGISTRISSHHCLNRPYNITSATVELQLGPDWAQLNPKCAPHLNDSHDGDSYQIFKANA